MTQIQIRADVNLKQEWNQSKPAPKGNGAYLSQENRHSGRNEVETRNPDCSNSAPSGFRYRIKYGTGSARMSLFPAILA